MQLVHLPQDVRRWRAACARANDTVALVPTMGALHEGHLALIAEARRRARRVAVSLFVNPKQFGPSEDLSRYPRTLEADRAKCEAAGVELLYAPATESVYPKGFQTSVKVEVLTRGLDGASRPGHFEGVATVVTKLFGLFRPEVAVFGEKDYQQLCVIQTLNRDLDLGVEVVGHPTVREADGLAKSSRNAYLDAAQRKRALALSQGLFAAREKAAGGERSAAALVGCVRDALRAVEAREDYVALVDAETLEPLSALEGGRPSRLLVAAYIGTTRLIDNVGL